MQLPAPYRPGIGVPSSLMICAFALITGPPFVSRVPALSFIDMDDILVFARFGRLHTDGAFATCHCLSLPPSEPGYYFWRDRATGTITRRSEWFVTKSPVITIGTSQIDYMISFALPRFCDQQMSRSRKQVHYVGQPNWVAKLDTIVHELYHIDPANPGIRRMEKADGTYSANCHGGEFFENVVEMVNQYLATKPDPAVYDFLEDNLEDLTAKFGGVLGTTFRSFPSYPQRYTAVVDPQPPAPVEMAGCRVDPVKTPRVATRFTMALDADTTLAAWASSSSFPNLFASDPDQTVAKLYGSADGKSDTRNVFVIAPDGRIAYRSMKFNVMFAGAYEDLGKAVARFAQPSGPSH